MTALPLVPRLDLAAFKAKAKRLADSSRPRLVFGVDATGSREHTWAFAQQLQQEMLSVAASLGTLELQIAMFSGAGISFSPWSQDGTELSKAMASLKCITGTTQIYSLLLHTLEEAKTRPIRAMTFIGDAMEEDLPTLCAAAKALNDLNIKLFLFHEGPKDFPSNSAFEEIAKANGGAAFSFDESSISKLKDLLSAITEYAIGGIESLKRSQLPGAKLLLAHLSESLQ